MEEPGIGGVRIDVVRYFVNRGNYTTQSECKINHSNTIENILERLFEIFGFLHDDEAG